MAASPRQTERSSHETERRHLLSQSQQTTPAPSTATSIINFDGEATPRSRSPAQSQREQQPSSQAQNYRGFPSEAAYLEALKQWADSKRFLEPEIALQGFYGDVTMEEYAAKPKLKVEGLGLRRKWKDHKEKRREEKLLMEGRSGRGMERESMGVLLTQDHFKANTEDATNASSALYIKNAKAALSNQLRHWITTLRQLLAGTRSASPDEDVAFTKSNGDR